MTQSNITVSVAGPVAVGQSAMSRDETVTDFYTRS